MNTVSTRSPFFPKGKTPQSENAGRTKATGTATIPERNSSEKANDISARTSDDAKVSINESVKDFARIKKVADAAAPIDNSEKIARLKNQIQSGEYQIDYDAVADRMLSSEF